jgi:hypothetical protein
LIICVALTEKPLPAVAEGTPVEPIDGTQPFEVVLAVQYAIG